MNLTFTGNTFSGYAPWIRFAALEGWTEADTINFCNTNDSICPATCLFTKFKKALFGNNVILRLQEVWTEQVLSANRILIIGAAWSRDDSHIWSPLTETGAKVGYAGSKKSYDNWIKSGRHGNKTHYLGYDW